MPHGEDSCELPQHYTSQGKLILIIAPQILPGTEHSSIEVRRIGLNEDEQPNEEAPFLSGEAGSKGWDHYFSSLYSHISCERLAFSVGYRGELNPYTDRTTGFPSYFLR
jgi:hypothetical protein